MQFNKGRLRVNRKFDTLKAAFLVPYAILVCFENCCKRYVIDLLSHRYNRTDIVVVVLVVRVTITIVEVDVPRKMSPLS